MISARLEKRLLQGAILVAGLVPVGGGLQGVLGAEGDPFDASHARYLSGLLLGIGLTFWACTPQVERRGPVVRALAAIVVVGGLARLSGIGHTGLGPVIGFTLAMELVVTPLIALWRERVEHRLARRPGAR